MEREMRIKGASEVGPSLSVSNLNVLYTIQHKQ